MIASEVIFPGKKPQWCRYGLRVPRGGIALHYDGSSTDAGSVNWFKDPRCKAGYNWLVLDDGKILELGGADVRAWHMGHCRPSAEFKIRDGYQYPNSFFYGISAATNATHAITQEQLYSIANLCLVLFRQEGWQLQNDTWRITGHKDEAVFGPEHPDVNLRGKRGRKTDPEPAFSVSQVLIQMRNI